VTVCAKATFASTYYDAKDRAKVNTGLIEPLSKI
jgi:hypothetical protein